MVGMQNGTNHMEGNLAVFNRSIEAFTFDPVILQLGIYFEDNLKNMKHICARLFTAAPFGIAKYEKNRNAHT